MAGELPENPELRFTGSGTAVASFTVGSTPRTFDRQSGEWRDGDALFLRCTAWRDLAKDVGESLARGTRVVVQGRLRQRSFENREGEKRTVMELEADQVGPSLRFATVKVTKAAREVCIRPRGIGLVLAAGISAALRAAGVEDRPSA